MSETTVIPPDYKGLLIEDHDRDGRRNGDDTPYRPAERLKDAISESLEQTLQGISGTVVAVERNGRSAELATEKTGAAGQLTTEKVGAAASLQAEHFAAATAMVVEKTSSAVALANAMNFQNVQNMLVTGFKDARYDSAVTTAALQASMAACCCEIKELVKDEAGKTRDLINSVDGRRADRELVDAKNEVTALKYFRGGHGGHGGGPGPI